MLYPLGRIWLARSW